MAKQNLIVRNVDKKIFQEFKAQATKEGITVGKAISLAMFMWIGHERKRKRMSILDIKPVDYKSKNASRNIDKDLHGG